MRVSACEKPQVAEAAEKTDGSDLGRCWQGQTMRALQIQSKRPSIAQGQTVAWLECFKGASGLQGEADGQKTCEEVAVSDTGVVQYPHKHGAGDTGCWAQSTDLGLGRCT